MTNPPDIRLRYSLGDSSQEIEVGLFQRDESYFLTFCWLPDGREDSSELMAEPVRHEIQEHEFQSIHEAFERVHLPLTHHCDVARLGSRQQLTIGAFDSTVSLSWGQLPNGWEPLAEAVQKLQHLKFRYTGFYL